MPAVFVVLNQNLAPMPPNPKRHQTTVRKSEFFGDLSWNRDDIAIMAGIRDLLGNFAPELDQ